jgi:hypothetical protein
MQGFVGGVQTVAVWGLILILTAGFVFLALYMRMLMEAQKQHVSSLAQNEVISSASSTLSMKKHGHLVPKLVKSLQAVRRHQISPHSASLKSIGNFGKPGRKILLGMIAFLVGVSLTAGTVVYGANRFHWMGQPNLPMNKTEEHPSAAVLPTLKPVPKETDHAASPPPEVSPEDVMMIEQKQVLGAATSKNLVKVAVEGKGVKMHQTAAGASEVVKIFHEDRVVEKLGAEQGWIHVSYSQVDRPEIVVDGWISQEFIKALP